MRSFTRVNFMLALRLIKMYNQHSAKSATQAAVLFRHVSLLALLFFRIATKKSSSFHVLTPFPPQPLPFSTHIAQAT